MRNYLICVGILILGISLGAVGDRFYQNGKIISYKCNETTNSKHGEIKNLDPFFNGFFDDSFFRNDRFRDPFSHMESMRKWMGLFKDNFNNSEIESSFDEWFDRTFGGSIFEISQSEDSDYVYYKIGMKDVDEKSLKVEVKNQRVLISGNFEKVDETQRVRKEFKRTFPVPFGTDEGSVQFERKEGYLIVKFPKRQPS